MPLAFLSCYTELLSYSLRRCYLVYTVKHSKQ